jgi:hypothetical protein
MQFILILNKQDIRYQMPDAVYRMPDAGCSLPSWGRGGGGGYYLNFRTFIQKLF